jgi:hypothetical protein
MLSPAVTAVTTVIDTSTVVHRKRRENVMKAFQSIEQMLETHELMFGPAGRSCAELVQKWAKNLFLDPLDDLNIRIVLAPVELGPYNKHVGYHYRGHNEDGTFILGNRHIVELADGVLRLRKPTDNGFDWVEDFNRARADARPPAGLAAATQWRKGVA